MSSPIGELFAISFDPTKSAINCVHQLDRSSRAPSPIYKNLTFLKVSPDHFWLDPIKSWPALVLGTSLTNGPDLIIRFAQNRSFS